MAGDRPSPALQRRRLAIPGSHNIRDLGGYRTRRGGETPWRSFLRADSLHRLDHAGVDRLLREGVTTVIDLRTPAEVAQAPNPFRQVGGVAFHNLPLLDSLAPATLGRATSTAADPLLDFYLSALHTRHGAIGEIFTVMAEAGDGAVLFNCTAGKDRTGIVAALLLGLAGVSRRDIISDYVLTAAMIPELVAEFLDLSRRRGGDVEAYARMLRSPADTMQAALDSIEAVHGDIRGYLEFAGMRSDRISMLESRLGA